MYHFEGVNGSEYRVELKIGRQRMSRICRTDEQMQECINEIGTVLGITEAKFDTKVLKIVDYTPLEVQ